MHVSFSCSAVDLIWVTFFIGSLLQKDDNWCQRQSHLHCLFAGHLLHLSASFRSEGSMWCYEVKYTEQNKHCSQRRYTFPTKGRNTQYTVFNISVNSSRRLGADLQGGPEFNPILWRAVSQQLLEGSVPNLNWIQRICSHFASSNFRSSGLVVQNLLVLSWITENQ